MKPVLFVALILSLFLVSCEQENFLSADMNRQFLIESDEKNTTYPIWVQLPEGYYNNSDNYATIYVLDASDNQEFVAQTCRDVSARLNVRNAIVVGIGYGDDRETDYTPTHTDIGDGESPQFLNFIKNELIPRIEVDFRAEPSRNARVIIGHSFGGLCAAYSFTNHNEVFGNYLLLSASLFYDNDIVMQYEQEIRPQIKDQKQLVYIGAGGTEGPLLVGNDLLHRRLNDYYTNEKSTFDLIQGKGHNSSKNQNIRKAIKFYFQNR